MSPRPPHGKSAAARRLTAVLTEIEDFEGHAKHLPEDIHEYILEVFRILRATAERPRTAATSTHKRGPTADLSLAVACQRVRDEGAGMTVASTAELMDLSQRYVLQAVRRHSTVARLLWRLDQGDLKVKRFRQPPVRGVVPHEVRANHIAIRT
jgi:hypothetical protein